MTKYQKFYILLAVTLPLLMPHKTYAYESSVHVESEGDSHATVNIQSSTNSTSNSTTDVQTSIRIKSNGQVKTYESNKAEDIKIESNDGNSKVEIKNNNTTTPKATGSATDSAKNEFKNNIQAKEAETENANDTKNLFEVIADFFKSIFTFGDNKS